MHTQYQHGGDIYSNKVSMDYSANIKPLGLPQGVKEELARCIEEPVCCVYPDSQCRDLVKALADYHKVTQDWILCGDGAADLIFGLAFALKPKKALLLAPSFQNEYLYSVHLPARLGMILNQLFEYLYLYFRDYHLSPDCCQDH